MSETTALRSLKEFCAAVVRQFGAEYFRSPNVANLSNIEIQLRRVGSIGCMGMVDCASFTWKMCPIALQGIYTARKAHEKPECFIEIMCDIALHVWYLFCGLP